MDVDLKLAGLAELQREMQKLGDAVATRLGRNAVMAGARVVAATARTLAPVDEGDLRRSIRARRDPQWRQQRSELRAFANARDWKAHLLEYGTAKMAARPYLRPAVDTSGPEVEARMVANLARGIDRELKKQRVAEDPGEDL